MLAAVVYDVIPFLFPPARAPLHPDTLARHRAGPVGIRCAARDLRLDAAGRDPLLGLDPDRVTTIGTAADGAVCLGHAAGGGGCDELRRIGIDRPYVLCVSGMDPRKNFHGLAAAYSRMPEALRRSHRLAVACDIRPEARADAVLVANALGIGEALVLTGEVSDETLARSIPALRRSPSPRFTRGSACPSWKPCDAARWSSRPTTRRCQKSSATRGCSRRRPIPRPSCGRSRVLGDPTLAADLCEGRRPGLGILVGDLGGEGPRGAGSVTP